MPALGAGLRYVAMSPNLMRVMLRGLLFGLGAVSILALLPLIARDLVRGGAFVYGILLGFFGLGAICGGLLNATIRKRFSNEAIVRGAFIGFGLATMMLSQSTWLWLSPVSYTHLDVYKRQASSMATKVNSASVTFSRMSCRPRRTQASISIAIEVRPTRASVT